MLLTGPLYRYFKKNGYMFFCPRCTEPITLGDTIVPNRNRRNKRIFHKQCWERHCAEPSGDRRRLLPIPLGYKSQSAAPHITLKRGVYSVNPGEVLCPKLAEGLECSKHTHESDSEFKLKRPKLLLQHYGVESLSLWACEGCEKFWLRVQRC